MIFCESYLFVLIISSFLSVPIGLTIRTLLAMKHHVVLPILRLRRTTGTVLAAKIIQGDAGSSTQAGRQS